MSTASYARQGRVSILVAVLIAFQSLIAVAELEIKDGYVRGLPPGQPVTAAFMRLVNSGDTAIDIISASSDRVEKAEFHRHQHRNGMMSMQRVESITVPAKGEFLLSPGNFHLMLINLYQPLREGDAVAIELRSRGGDVWRAELPVRSVLNE